MDCVKMAILIIAIGFMLKYVYYAVIITIAALFDESLGLPFIAFGGMLSSVLGLGIYGLFNKILELI